MSIDNVLTALSTIVGTIWGVFGDVASTVISNPLLFVPVLFGFGASIVMFCIALFKKLGVRGIASSGRRRRRR